MMETVDKTNARPLPSMSSEPASNRARRDFLFVGAGAAAGIATGSLAWPIVDLANPGELIGGSAIEVDLTAIQPGQIVTLKWQGKPIFIRHRTESEIEAARNTPLTDLSDPQKDEDRVKSPEWLVVVGLCTHLGCVPLGHLGEYGGWFCPCHSSVFDTSGRVRRGPAPRNMEVPEYVFLSDAKLKIG
jgi:ubiquinol-cytochrome c reductase iron-sulfur subunit